jgi:pilin isopeptide linkage protein
MKKLLTFCILILLVPGLFGFTAYAYDYVPIKYEIEVEVTLGGTVKIIPNVNCPIPQKTELTLKDGETGRFDIDFVEPGDFDYTVKTVPDERDIIFDDTIYNIKIYVTDRDGTLEANMIASKSEEKYSGDTKRLIFVNAEKSNDEPTTNSTDTPTESSDNGGSPLDKNRNPKTGDDARMELYFLLAMIASAGLLALSIVYLIDTQKMINKKNKEEN